MFFGSFREGVKILTLKELQGQSWDLTSKKRKDNKMRKKIAHTHTHPQREREKKYERGDNVHPLRQVRSTSTFNVKKNHSLTHCVTAGNILEIVLK